MALRLIVERIDDFITPQILTEASTGAKGYFIEGPFLQAEKRNKNDRYYPMSIMEREVARYTREFVNEQRALGELGHPNTPSINHDRVSHKIVSLVREGKDFIGKAKILSEMPMGRIVKTLMDEDVKFGVSSRGLGSLTPSSQGNIVGEDFWLATAADIVHDPSAPDAFVRGIMENKEWVWNNGVLCEREVNAIKETIIAAPQKKADARRLVETRAFERFLKGLRVKVGR